MKPLITLIVFLFSFTASFSQETAFSEPLDLPLSGWNKVLQLSNGNTMLFHAEKNKSILVQLFDKEHKLIGADKFLGKLMDNSLLHHSLMYGVYEINDQAVMFVKQEIYNKETLVRICFDANTGKFIEEKKVLASASLRDAIDFSLVMNPISGGYAVFAMRTVTERDGEKLYLHVYDKEHKEVSKVEVTKNAQNYDRITHIGTDACSDGSIVVSLMYSKIIHYPSDYLNELVICYLSNGDSSFKAVVSTELPDNVAPYYSMSAYDAFEKRLNYLMVSGIDESYNNGLEKTFRSIYDPALLRYALRNFGDMKYEYIQHRAANAYLQQESDSTYYSLRKTPLAPLFFNTNKYGMSTIVSEIIHEGVELDGVSRLFTCIGDVVITQVGSDGEEIWGTVLPKRQMMELNTNGFLLRNRDTKRYWLRSKPEHEWEYQFASFNTYYTPRRNTFVIYNDLVSNINKPLSTAIDTAYTMQNTNAVYCKVSRSREVYTDFLYGEPNGNESFAAIIESADYSRHTQTYCTVVQHTAGDKKELLLGWSKLNDD